MNDSTGGEGVKQDLTSANYWDREWDGTLQRRVANWRRRRGRRREGKAVALLDLLTSFLDQTGLGPLDVLEIGCAPGGILARLQQRRPVHRYHGLDYAKKGLAQTARFLNEIRVPATLHCDDVRQFRPPRKYDVVYSCGLIEHFTDPLPIVEHHARLCAPGGIVVVTVPNYSGVWQEWLIDRLDPQKLRMHNLSVMSAESLGRILAAARLLDVDTGALGRGKFSVSCQVRNGWTLSLRMAAKAWNAAQRLLPLAPNWHATYWAAGRVPKVGRVSAA